MDKDFQYTIVEYYESDSKGNPVSSKYKSADFFRKPDLTLAKEREKSFRGTKYICAGCMEPLYIAGGVTERQRVHFKHKEANDYCEYSKDNKYTKEEAKRIIFYKKKESEDHENLKIEIADKLSAAGYDCELEKVTRDPVQRRSWRKADILMKDSCKEREVAIEVQISYTFLSEIFGRHDFYPTQNKYLLWVFKIFKGQLYQLDILIQSNKNVFIYDEDAREASDKSHKLMLKCYYVTYKIEENKVVENDKLDYKLVCFPDDFTFTEDYKLYAVDTDKQKKEEEDKLAKIKKEEARIQAEIKEENKYYDDYQDMEFALQGFVEHIYPDYNKMTITEFLNIYNDRSKNEKGYIDAIDNFYRNIFKESNTYYSEEYINIMLFDRFQSWYRHNIEYIRSQIDIAKDKNKTSKKHAERYILFNCYARIILYFHKKKRSLFPNDIVNVYYNNMYQKFCEWGRLEELQKKAYIFLRLISPRFGRILSFNSDSTGSLNNDILMKGYYHIYERCLEKCSNSEWKTDYYDRKEIKSHNKQLKDINHDLDDLYKIIFDEKL